MALSVSAPISSWSRRPAGRSDCEWPTRYQLTALEVCRRILPLGLCVPVLAYILFDAR